MPTADHETLPPPSVVLEWENVVLSETDRANRVLATLGDQLRELADRFESEPEVLLCCDTHKIDRSVLEEATERYLTRGEEAPFRAEVVPSEGADYYEQKNRGARRATNDVVVFLDSDAVPEDGWLEAILTPFADPATDVVAGHTYLVDGGFYERAFGYFWFFPAADQPRDTGFFANNVAFRRELFLAYEFPSARTFRGQCSRLADALYRDGVGIRQQPTAVCSHPPPNGPGHFVVRAVADGHDAAVANGQDGPVVGVARAFGSLAARLLTVARRVLARATGGEDAPDAGTLVAAVAVGVVYYAIATVGQVATVLAPDLVERHVHI